MRDRDLIVPSPAGLYCPRGDFHIDPWRPVPQAVITHGHSDHARPGMGISHFAAPGFRIMQWRLDEGRFEAHEYGERFALGDAVVSLHPAGHVLGSAQVRIEVDGEVWVVSGDYKRQADPTCAPFEPVPCDVFITEATFGLPVYRWPAAATVVRDVLDWQAECAARAEPAILYCYALGKAQRLLAELGVRSQAPVWLHGAIDSGVEVYRASGIELPPTRRVADAPDGESFAGGLILAPPSASASPWMRRFPKARQALASGWMRIRGNRRRRNHDRGFVLSDHADWPDLLRTIAQTGARRVIATHGQSDALVHALTDAGLQAGTFTTPFGDGEE